MHGPHQVDQKLMTTGRFLRSDIFHTFPSRSVRVTVTSRSVVNSPSKAENRKTYSPATVPVTAVVSASPSTKITLAPSGVETISQP